VVISGANHAIIFPVSSVEKVYCACWENASRVRIDKVRRSFICRNAPGFICSRWDIRNIECSPNLMTVAKTLERNSVGISLTAQLTCLIIVFNVWSVPRSFPIGHEFFKMFSDWLRCTVHSVAKSKNSCKWESLESARWRMTNFCRSLEAPLPAVPCEIRETIFPKAILRVILVTSSSSSGLIVVSAADRVRKNGYGTPDKIFEIFKILHVY